MPHTFQRVRYADLNARQQESCNFQKASAELADFGFVTMRLSDDWRGADFIAQHIDGITFLKVQLKGRLTFAKKYQGRDIHVCFPSNGLWFIYSHDELLPQVMEISGFSATVSWKKGGAYSFPRLSKKLREVLEPYRLQSHDLRQ